MQSLEKLASILAIIASLFLACHKDHEPAMDPRVELSWRQHEKAFSEALRGEGIDEEFSQACDFFARLTGIEIHLNFTTLVVLPTPETANDFRLIQAWYKENKHRLYWDDSAREVRVRSKGLSHLRQDPTMKQRERFDSQPI